MQINLATLLTYGASTRKYNKGELIFMEGDMPSSYFQVLEGTVKVYSTNNEGKELIQGLFSEGDSFGEPPLFIDKPYPSAAMTVTEAVIVRLSKDKLFCLLEDSPGTATCFLKSFALRIYDKAATIHILIGHSPEEKILGFLDKYKSERELTEPVKIPFTRQQIGDFTGLRVETVIRTLTKLHSEKKVEIINHKVHY